MTMPTHPPSASANVEGASRSRPLHPEISVDGARLLDGALGVERRPDVGQQQIPDAGAEGGLGRLTGSQVNRRSGQPFLVGGLAEQQVAAPGEAGEVAVRAWLGAPDDPEVETASEGTEPNRFVVIIPRHVEV